MRVDFAVQSRDTQRNFIRGFGGDPGRFGVSNPGKIMAEIRARAKINAAEKLAPRGPHALEERGLNAELRAKSDSRHPVSAGMDPLFFSKKLD